MGIWPHHWKTPCKVLHHTNTTQYHSTKLVTHQACRTSFSSNTTLHSTYTPNPAQDTTSCHNAILWAQSRTHPPISQDSNHPPPQTQTTVHWTSTPPPPQHQNLWQQVHPTWPTVSYVPTHPLPQFKTSPGITNLK